MKEKDVQHLEYCCESLDEVSLHKNPYDQFSQWFQEASGIDFSDSCVLSTVDLEGRPDSRVVLCRSFSSEGFVFFTDYSSSKGRQIRENNAVSLLFYWKEQQRQVRIFGYAYRLPVSRNEDYFSSRPFESQVSALLNRQSRVLSDTRNKLEERFDLLANELSVSGVLSCPSYWGGYRVYAIEFEFWQGLPRRLHDRFLYRKEGVSCWSRCRLSP